MKEIIADIGRFKNLEVENKIQLRDQATGEIYCVWIENGEWVKVKGECETASNGATNNQATSNEQSGSEQSSTNSSSTSTVTSTEETSQEILTSTNEQLNSEQQTTNNQTTSSE